jgi:hypothetical protein
MSVLDWANALPPGECDVDTLLDECPPMPSSCDEEIDVLTAVGAFDVTMEDPYPAVGDEEGPLLATGSSDAAGVDALSETDGEDPYEDDGDAAGSYEGVGEEELSETDGEAPYEEVGDAVLPYETVGEVELSETDGEGP